MLPPDPTAARVRIVYVDGPGDVARTYGYWKQGQADPAEVNQAFSAGFYDLCRRIPVDALVISTNPRRIAFRDGAIEIIQRPVPFARRPAPLYFLGQALFSCYLIYQVVRFRADVLMAQPMGLPWLLAPLAWCGVRVVPIMHNTLWPRGYRPASRAARVQQRLLGWFWRRVATMGLAVSPECAAQLAELTAGRNCRIVQTRVQYPAGYFASVPPPVHGQRPFRALFAARMEWNKGIAEVLTAARQLEQANPGAFAFDLCGGGTALDQVRQQVEREQLRNVVLHGPLDRTAMRERYAAAHAVLVPTGRDFAEGLSRVAVEGVLTCRPLVLTSVCVTADFLTDCALEVPPNDAAALAAALLRLKNDGELYTRLVRAEQAAQAQFYDQSQGWAERIELICRTLLGNGADNPARGSTAQPQPR